jgi:UPF0755 protein
VTPAYRAGVTAMTLLAVVVFAALAVFVYRTPGGAFSEPPRTTPPLHDEGEPLIVVIDPGENAQTIGRTLEELEVIRSGRLFEVLVGLTGVDDSLEAGEYEFERGIPAVEAVQRISRGQVASRQVTIPEGRRVSEIAQILEQRGIVTAEEFFSALDAAGYDEPFLAHLPNNDLEGFLYPAGYAFTRNTDAGQVVAAMLRGFQDTVWEVLDIESHPLSLLEIVTLASIVEREAATPEERPLIASVFLNRLEIGMALEADPTVQFALSLDPQNVARYGIWKEQLTLDDLEFDSPYNTYRYPGLPPGPIANPGFDSIAAVLDPADTDYFFFVSRNDGTHVFAETFEEHLQNVQQYQ